jgi:polyhydroxyalkanoate synthase
MIATRKRFIRCELAAASGRRLDARQMGRARRAHNRRMDWRLFEQLDLVRRAQGSLLDAFGLGPLQTPCREIHREPGVALRRYGSDAAGGPLVLIVPAPIKRPYIWDLSPEVSAVRRCLDAGARVLLADWQPAPSGYGLADYAERLILACLDAARGERAVLLAHSLGGLFAAIFASLHPERVQGLALIASPLHFGGAAPVFGAMVAQLDARALPESMPGSFLSSASLNAAPGVFGSERLLDAFLSAADVASLRTHLLVERWALDEFALPRRLVAELAERIVREDRFLRGTLEIDGRTAAPAGITAPLLCVLDPRCELVPPAAVLPFVEAAGSREKTVLRYEGDVGVALQHVGPLVGRNAHATLWPRIVEWIARTWVDPGQSGFSRR